MLLKWLLHALIEYDLNSLYVVAAKGEDAYTLVILLL